MDFLYITCLAVFTLPLCLGQNPTVSDGAVDFEMKINPEKPEQQFQIGDNRILICEASTTADGQRPDLHWEINGERVTATGSNDRIRTEDFNGNLLLRNADVQDGDDGVYKCVGTLAGQTDFRSVTVEVFMELEVHSSEEQYGILGEDGEVMCEATGKPAPSTSWKFANGTRILNSDKYIIQPSKLIIKNLEFSDAKRYLCDIIVINTGKSRAFFINYQVVQKPTIPLPPTIQPNNPKVGDEVKIQCKAEGVPAPTYQFRRGDNLLAEDKVDEVNGILTLPDLRREDEATYTCVASNRGGSAESSNTLDVKIPPVIQDMGDITDAVSGGEVSVTCTAEGDPSPTVTWKKQGFAAYTDGSRDEGPQIVAGEGDEREEAEIKRVVRILQFKPVRPQDAGTYICTALNVVGNASKEIKFEVQYPPHFETDFEQTVFYGWRGHKANLTCQASANGMATITWYIPDSEFPDDVSKATVITNSPPYSIPAAVSYPDKFLTSQSLLIDIGDGEDRSLYKNYMCEAKNLQGSATHEVTLQEALAPAQPVVRVGSILSTMVTLEVDTPTNNGGQPVTYYLSEYSPADSPSDTTRDQIDKTGETSLLELRNLEPATSYVVKVQAGNAVGAGTAQSITFETKKVSKPLKLVFTSNQEGSEPTSYKVKWAEPDNGGAPIQRFVVKYKRVAVEGTDPEDWVVAEDLDADFTVKTIESPNAREFTMSGLQRDSYYDVRITAVNKEGESAEEFRIIKTSKGDDGDWEEEEADDSEENIIVDGGDDKNDGARNDEEKENENADGTIGESSETLQGSGAGGLGSGAIIGIVLAIALLILLIVAIVLLIIKKKPELLGKLGGRFGGAGGEEERGKKEDGKDPAEEEKLIKKEDAVKVENETEEGKADDQVVEVHHEEFEPDNKPDSKAEDAAEVAKDGAAEKPQDLSTPAPPMEIKVTPETPEKPESPPA